MRLASVSVDLDEIPNYYAIHGLAPRGVAATLVYDRAVERLSRWAASHSFPLTLFAIGRDLERAEARAALVRAHAEGHEIANHTLDHRYDLCRLSPREMSEQVEGGRDAIARAVGEAPVGFRAPGYTFTDALAGVVERSGALYDASVFPCPAYYAAKVATIARLSAAGTPSQSVVDHPRVLTAPVAPYRLSPRYTRRGSGMVEIPVQVTRGLRLPFIGTSLTLGGPRVARALARMCVGLEHVNLELHGIDVLDAEDGLEELSPHQPDVRVPRARKLAALTAAVAVLQSAGYRFVTMRALAASVATDG